MLENRDLENNPRFRVDLFFANLETNLRAIIIKKWKKSLNKVKNVTVILAVWSANALSNIRAHLRRHKP